MIRVAFFGNGNDYSSTFLKALAAFDGVRLVAIVCPTTSHLPTRPRRFGASFRQVPDGVPEALGQDVLAAARHDKADVFWPSDVNDRGLVDQLEVLDPDVVVMAGFNQILKPWLITALKPIVNVHPSLLPAFRGPHPEFWSIAMGARESGVTLHLVDDGIDTGPILAQERFEVEPWLTAGELQSRCCEVGAGMLIRLLMDFESAVPFSWAQSGSASYQGKVELEDIVVPFASSSVVAYDRSRASTPWLTLVLWVPSEFWRAPIERNRTCSASMTAAPDMVQLSLGDASNHPDAHIGTPGTVRRTEAGGLAVACDTGVVFFRIAQAR